MRHQLCEIHHRYVETEKRAHLLSGGGAGRRAHCSPAARVSSASHQRRGGGYDAIGWGDYLLRGGPEFPSGHMRRLREPIEHVLRSAAAPPGGIVPGGVSPRWAESGRWLTSMD
jgi:hypothetical protein